MALSLRRLISSLFLRPPPPPPPPSAKNFRSDAALEALAKASEAKTPNLVLYNYPSFSGAFSALFAHLYHSRLNLPCLILPFSPVAPFRFCIFAILCTALLVGTWKYAFLPLPRRPFTAIQGLQLVDDVCIKALEKCYLLDFLGPKDFALELSRKVQCEVIAFDHRKPALSKIPPKNDFDGNLRFHVNLEKSSSIALYDYFSSKLAESGHNGDKKGLLNPADQDRVERLLKFIEDGDLRKWALPEITAFNIGIREWRSKFNCITNARMYEQLMEMNAVDVIGKGNSYMSARQSDAKKWLDKAFKVRLGRGLYGECLGVRADGNSDLSDEIGKELCQKSTEAGLRPIGAVIYMQRKNLKMSLRSTDSRTDVSEVAKAYGGGGSPSSSSFIIRMDEYNQWLSMHSSRAH